MTTKKIQALTPEQEALFPEYVRKGIEIGLATGAEFDEKLVRALTDKHRVLYKVKKAKNFLIFDSPFAACKAIPELNPGNALYGQHDVGWLYGYYEFFRKECGVQGLDGIQYLLELCNHVGWMWMGRHTTVVTRRPVEIHLLTKTQGPKVLHNAQGMALKYADGTGIYCLNGTRIPIKYKHLVEARPEDMDIKEILDIENVEIRYELLKKGGKYAFDGMDKTLLHEATLAVGGKYSLYKVKFGEDERVYLRGASPSNQEVFFDPVHPDCATIYEALLFRDPFTTHNWKQIAIEQGYTEPLVMT